MVENDTFIKGSFARRVL